MASDDGEALPILLRAFSEEMPADLSKVGKSRRKGSGRRVPEIGPADMHLIFDTETTTDAAMRCRLGFYQLHNEGGLIEEGLFHDPRKAFAGDDDTIRAYAAARGMNAPIAIEAFRRLLLKVIRAGGQIVGFNLPFDLSRIAIGSAPARTSPWNRKMQGGFTLALSDSAYDPRIQIRHLNPRLSLMGCTAPNEGATRSTRKRGDDIPPDRGAFIDVRTLASALLSGGFSLERLCRRLNVPTQKAGTSEHGKPLAFDYLDYARADVRSTWECYCALRDRYAGFGLSAPLHSILSEAGLGKAMLAGMGIKAKGPSDPASIARSLHSYFGGRTEVRIRRKVTRVVQTDFMSMYPTVCVLMGLWRFVIADRIIERDATEEVRALLASATPEGWREQSAWRNLTTLVRVKCVRDMFPVRSYYQGERHASIGLNPLSCKTPLWLTLADCLAAKFQSGKTPEILEAVAFEPGPPQTGLKPISLLGRMTIDPYVRDPFRELVVMREKGRLRAASASDAERAAIEEFRQLLKILVNSASYGIFVQLNVNDEERKVWRFVHVHGETPFAAKIDKSEEPGPYFHPLLATLITGAARLMLALAQCRADAEGLCWAFCDTDSIALAMPEGMEDGEFLDQAERVSDWFKLLNPYGFDASILKVESINFRPGTNERQPLYCYAIASKRYALFNIDKDGWPVIRKASAHGLGHLAAPYDDDDGAPSFPPPIEGLMADKDRLARWQYDVWYAILAHEMSGASGRVRFDYHPALRRPAMSRCNATSPAMLRWFDSFNDGLDYDDRIKPFGPLYMLHAKRRMFDHTGIESLTGANPEAIHPIAPFHPDRDMAVSLAFDRISGEPVAADRLQTYADALFNYPYRPESKFANGEAFQRGLTVPHHVAASEIHYIGKEADRWEEDFLIGLGFDPMTYFGRDPNDAAQLYTEIRAAVRIHGQKPVADAMGLARGTVARICDGKSVRTKVPHKRIRQGLRRLMAECVSTLKNSK